MSGLRWTPEMDDELRRLAGQDLTAGQIARATGYGTRNAIIGRMRRMGIGLMGSSLPDRGPIRIASRRAPSVQKKPSAIPAAVPAAESVAVPMIEAPPNVCRYPLWDIDGNPDFLVCGAPGYPWCPYHARKMFGAGTASERSAERTARAVVKAEAA